LCIEATYVLGREITEKRKAAFAGAKGRNAGRIALQALAEDLHEKWATDDERLEYYRQITQATGWLLVGYGAVLVALLLAVVLNPSGQPSPSNANLQPSLHNVRILLIVLAAGLTGAGMSMMFGLNDRLEAASMGSLEKMALWSNRFGRSVIGATAALVLFALCLAGLLEGKTMPQLHKPGAAAGVVEPLDAATLAHLVVICILAGFSEKFIPTKLAELE
jgi:hypothetical protein